MQVSFILLLIVSIFIAIFAIQNGETVSIDLFFLKTEMSQALVILASVGLGALVAVVLSTFGKVKRLREIKSLNKRVKVLEDEQNRLKTQLDQTSEENTSLQSINADLKLELDTTERNLGDLKQQIKIVSTQDQIKEPVVEVESPKEEDEPAEPKETLPETEAESTD
jgi:uncharacterized integral membrane protein